MIERFKKDTGNASDIVYKEIVINDSKITLIYSETLTDSEKISNLILKNISTIIDNKIIIVDLYSFFYNSIPNHNVVSIKTYKDFVSKIFNGFVIFDCDNKLFAMEVKASLDRGIEDASSEIALKGPKDSFTENYNKNLGLIRKRIKSTNLWIDNLTIGVETNTKIGICYMKSIVEMKNVKKIKDKLNNINIDGILDSGYIKDYITDEVNLFPTVMETERPDLVSMALLEGKIIIIVDNSPYVLIIPGLFIDFFHTPDDYYQKGVNISFIRIIRFLSFLLSIFIPGIYVAVTTLNSSILSNDLLHGFVEQRSQVFVSPFLEALMILIAFEILRESDTRMTSTVGTAVSILGGLVLGDAAVNAGLVSPIMIIVVAISAISGLVFTSIELTSAIRWWRFIFLLLGAFLGIYGLFIGTMFLIINLTSITTLDVPYLYPYSPLSLDDQLDGLIRINKKKKKRNKYLTKNIVRSR